MQPAPHSRESATRVAALLRPKDTLSDDLSSLASLRERVASFLTTAATTSTPAVPLEADASGAGPQDNKMSSTNDGDVETDEGVCVELNVVAGVLEEKPLVQREPGCAIGDVLLPTAQTAEVLQQRAVQEAQAMLGLMNALCSPSPSSTPLAHQGTTKETAATHEHAASEDDEVDIVDADELAAESSSEDEAGAKDGPPAQRRRIIELS